MTMTVTSAMHARAGARARAGAKAARLTGFLVGGLVLAACAPKVQSPAPNFGPANLASRDACIAATATTVGVPADGITVISAQTTDGVISVDMTVPGAEAPWTCILDGQGGVQQVMYSGSEGAL